MSDRRRRYSSLTLPKERVNNLICKSCDPALRLDGRDRQALFRRKHDIEQGTPRDSGIRAIARGQNNPKSLPVVIDRGDGGRRHIAIPPPWIPTGKDILCHRRPVKPLSIQDYRKIRTAANCRGFHRPELPHLVEAV